MPNSAKDGNDPTPAEAMAPAESGKWEDIAPLTDDDIRAFRNQRNGDLTRWDPAVGRKHYAQTKTAGG